MADKKALKSDPNENPWGDLVYSVTKGSNQVTAGPSNSKIKPTAVQNKGKLKFITLPSNLN